MSQTWQSDRPPDAPAIRLTDWPRIVARAAILIPLVFGGLGLLLLLRGIEVPFFGRARPMTSRLVLAVCRAALRVMGLRATVHGTPMCDSGAIVANHTSWLDIFVLNSLSRVYFVSKAEVAGWPGIGWLARATGTVFIERNRAKAQGQTALFHDRLSVGHRLLFFPEGTSTDGLQVLPFKTTLFQAFFASELSATLEIQPVSVVYHAPEGAERRFYGWWGDMTFDSHLLATLGARRQGRVDIVCHPPLAVRDYPNRKALAAACEHHVRSGHADYLETS